MTWQRSVTLIVVASTVVGVGTSLVHSVGQVIEFRPIHASGSWSRDDGQSGEWSAELGWEAGVVAGDVSIMVDQEVEEATFAATFAQGGSFLDAQVSLESEMLASISGVQLRGNAIEGTFVDADGISGAWSGNWSALSPTAEIGWVARVPRGSPGGRQSLSTETANERTRRLARKITVGPNKLVSDPNDFGTPQNEVEVAVDYSPAGRIAVTAIDATEFPNVPTAAPDLSYYISLDDGDT